MKPNFGGEVERRKCSRRVSPSEHRHRGMMPTETRIKISAFTREQVPAFKRKDKEEGSSEFGLYENKAVWHKEGARGTERGMS